ncbi:hypothetical protein [Salinivibrio socompensis]|uniref:hypothetical protein n=1 Tax=Salinivibrio socompensis TaxID=1510206 RepID=UPI00046EE1A5|nr:hypothetical protein [Salinivibrio socompensis]
MTALAMPTLAQIERESTQDVVNRLEIDDARKQAQNATPLSDQVTQPEVQDPARAEPEPPSPESPQSASETEQAPDSEPSEADAPQPEVVETLQSQLQSSDQEMTRLVESNHVLKVRLSEVQYELNALKEKMSSDDELNQEIRAFLEQQREQQAKQETQPPSAVDSLLDNPLLLAMLAIIPGALIAGGIFFFLARRKKQDEESDEPASLDHDELDDMPVIMVPDPEDEQEEENDPDQSDDELEITEDDRGDENVAFGDDTDLDDLNLDDELDDMSGNESSVAPTSDDAIGLEDMERALDELADTPPADTDTSADDAEQPEEEMSADEALALSGRKLWKKVTTVMLMISMPCSPVSPAPNRRLRKPPSQHVNQRRTWSVIPLLPRTRVLTRPKIRKSKHRMMHYLIQPLPMSQSWISAKRSIYQKMITKMIAKMPSRSITRQSFFE